MNTPTTPKAWLPSAVACCDGVGDDEEGWREGCDTCLRRTAARADLLQTSFIHPPSIIVFECEYLIEPKA